MLNEDVLFNEFSNENYFSGNDSENNQIYEKEMNAFLTTDVSLFTEPDNHEENEDRFNFSINAGKGVIEVRD